MMVFDYANNEDIVAVIKFEHLPERKYIFAAQDEKNIADILFEKLGEKNLEDNGNPSFMEASSWCTFASIGETFEGNNFTIQIKEADDKEKI